MRLLSLFLGNADPNAAPRVSRLDQKIEAKTYQLDMMATNIVGILHEGGRRSVHLENLIPRYRFIPHAQKLTRNALTTQNRGTDLKPEELECQAEKLWPLYIPHAIYCRNKVSVEKLPLESATHQIGMEARNLLQNMEDMVEIYYGFILNYMNFTAKELPLSLLMEINEYAQERGENNPHSFTDWFPIHNASLPQHRREQAMNNRGQSQSLLQILNPFA